MSRMPGTYEQGDQVRLRILSHVTGTVHYDNRKDGGRTVWVQWDNGVELHCVSPDEIISVEVGK
jgi:hypothetical protein